MAAQQAREVRSVRDAALNRLRAVQKLKAQESKERESALLHRLQLAREEGREQGRLKAKEIERSAQARSLAVADAFALEADVLVVESRLSRQRWGKALRALCVVGLLFSGALSLWVYKGAEESKLQERHAQAELMNVLQGKDKRLAQINLEQANHNTLSQLEISALDSELVQALRAAQTVKRRTAPRANLALKRTKNRSPLKRSPMHHGAGSVSPQHTKAVETTSVRSSVESSYQCLAGDPMCMGL